METFATLYFGKTLERKMKQHNITKAELARRIDVSDTTISRYVQGATKPKRLLLKRLADVLECSENELYKY